MPDNSPVQGPHQAQRILSTGVAIEEADGALILVHGRGATAASILELAGPLNSPGFSYLAPQAAGNSWYPNSFMNPMESNEPGLSSALRVLDDLIAWVEETGIAADKIVLGGFSQGACLVSEYVARHPRRYGGLLVFSGGLIGPPGTARDYPGTLQKMPVFVGCSDRDFHIPEERVRETATTLTRMGADVTLRIYPNMDHTIIEDEIEQAMNILRVVIDSKSDQ